MDQDESAVDQSRRQAEKYLGFSPKLDGFDPQQKTAYYAAVTKAGDAMQRLDDTGRIEDARPIAQRMSGLATVDAATGNGANPAQFVEHFGNVDASVAQAHKNLTPDLQRQNKEAATKILGNDPDLSKLSADQRDGYYQRVVTVDHLMKEGVGSPRQMQGLAQQEAALKQFPGKLAAEPADQAWGSLKKHDSAMIAVEDPNPEKLLDNKQRAEAALGFSPKLEGFDQSQKDAYYATIARANDAIKECTVQGRTRDGLEVAKALQPLVYVDAAKTPPGALPAQYATIDNKIEDAEKRPDAKVLAANQKQAVKILGGEPDLSKLSPDQQAGFYSRVVQMDRLTKEGVASPKAMTELNAQNENLKQLPARLATGSPNEAWKSIEKVDMAMTPVDVPEKQPGRLSRAWQSIKDAGSRAAENIKSIPDRIRARFSSEDPGSTPLPQQPAQGTPVVAKPPIAKDVQAIDNARAQGPELGGPPNAVQPQTVNQNGLHQPPNKPLPPLPNAQNVNQNGPQQPPNKPLPPLPNANPIGVSLGSDEAHAMPKGAGLQTGGVVESIEHKDGIATVHFKAGSHEQVLAVDEHSPGGKAVAEALDHLSPGDQMSMKISQDPNKHEVVEVSSKTQDFGVKVHEGGEVEKLAHAPQMERNDLRH